MSTSPHFSDRVRGLIPVRYRSQPYISVTRAKRRGWFDAIPAVEITEEDGEQELGTSQKHRPQEMSPEEFRKLAEEAVVSGEPYVRYRDGWMEVDPDRARRFLEFCSDHPKTDGDGKRSVNEREAQLVLDVISNTEVLEYDQSDDGPTLLPELPGYASPKDATRHTVSASGGRIQVDEIPA